MRIRPIIAAGVLLLASGCSSASGEPGGEQSPPTSARPEKQDPSASISGIEIKAYSQPQHISAPKRVDYDQSPPFGGSHDMVWAACNGVVYPQAVRNESMVHALEHGAVWIAYNPKTLPAAGVQALAKKVTGKPYTVMSPYPGLDRPVSLQSWGHRLKLDDPADPRVDEFVQALRQNSNFHPEPGAPCDSPMFDLENPPPFDPGPAPAGSIPVGG